MSPFLNMASLLVAALMAGTTSARAFSKAFSQKAPSAPGATINFSPSNSTMMSMEPRYFPEYNSSRTMVSYGPFTAAGSATNNGMTNFFNALQMKPCSGDCLITNMQAGLIYPNGSYANSDTGMWLHHVVLFNMDRSDAVCPTTEGYPLSLQRFFASGNERTVMDLTLNGTAKNGYLLRANETLASLLELMNEMPDPRGAVLTMDFEYIPSISPDFNQVDTLWLDAGGCNESDAPGYANQVFNLKSQPWQSNMQADVVATAGHLHDGGMDLQVMKNNQVMCDSVATYGATPGYIDMMANSSDMGGMGGMGGTGGTSSMDIMHISNMTYCAAPGTISPGDTMWVNANYNTSMHPPMLDNNGSVDSVMGIGIVYVVPSNDAEDGSGPAVNPGSNPMGAADPPGSKSDAAKTGLSAAVLVFAGAITAALLL